MLILRSWVKNRLRSRVFSTGLLSREQRSWFGLKYELGCTDGCRYVSYLYLQPEVLKAFMISGVVCSRCLRISTLRCIYLYWSSSLDICRPVHYLGIQKIGVSMVIPHWWIKSDDYNHLFPISVTLDMICSSWKVGCLLTCLSGWHLIFFPCSMNIPSLFR